MENARCEGTRERDNKNHPICPTCGQIIPSDYDIPKSVTTKVEKPKGKAEKRGSIDAFAFCEGPLGLMIAPQIERKKSLGGNGGDWKHSVERKQFHDGGDGDRKQSTTSTGVSFQDQEDNMSTDGSQKIGSKRNSLVNFIRKLSSPFVDDPSMDKFTLEGRRQSRAEKLETNVENYCRYAKYE